MRRPRDNYVNGGDNIDIVVQSKGDVVGVEKTDYQTLSVVFVSLLLDLLGFTVILPLFPTILDYYAQHDDQVCVSSTLVSQMIVVTSIDWCQCTE